MNVIDRYIAREVVKFFGLVLVLVLGIFVAVDYLGTMDEFIESRISLLRALIYVLLKLPFVVTQFIPVALLLAVLIVFGLMSKNNEIIIVRSSGISIYRLLRPIIVIGSLFSFLLVFLSEFLVPASMMKSNEIKYYEIRKEQKAIYKQENIWIKGNRQITHIKYFNPGEKTIYGISCHYFDAQFRLVRRLDAERGRYQAGLWHLENVMEQVSAAPGEGYKTRVLKKMTLVLDLEPADLQKVIKKSEEMNFRELWAYIRKIEKEGYDATVYKVDLYGKTAFPFVCIIMCLIGTSLTARGKIDKGLPVSIAYGIGIAFSYWVFYSFCLSLGYGELLPPFVAAWAANLIYLCLGAIYLIGAE